MELGGEQEEGKASLAVNALKGRSLHSGDLVGRKLGGL